MAITQQQFAVQSFCFRGFKDNVKTAELVKKIGLSAIELCGIHVDFNKPETFDAAINVYKQAGVKIVSIGVERCWQDEATARNRCEFVKKVGAKHMSVTFSPDSTPASFRLAEKLADEYDIKMGIHNHGGYDWLGSVNMLKYVMSVTSPRIGVCLDTAWAMQTGTPALDFIEPLAGRIFAAHVKDFVFKRDGKWEDVVVGKGNLPLAGLFDKLEKIGFNGPAILEYEGDVNDPTPALTECVKEMKALRK